MAEDSQSNTDELLNLCSGRFSARPSSGGQGMLGRSESSNDMGELLGLCSGKFNAGQEDGDGEERWAWNHLEFNWLILPPEPPNYLLYKAAASLCLYRPVRPPYSSVFVTEFNPEYGNTDLLIWLRKCSSPKYGNAHHLNIFLR